MSNGPSRVIIKVGTTADAQENMKVTGRKTLKVLQEDAVDKENLAGRPIAKAVYKSKSIYKSKAESETELSQLAKRKVLRTQSTQTDLAPENSSKNSYNADVEAVYKDLTSENPSEGYWEIMAERRRLALQDTLEENKDLYNRIDALQEELDMTRKMLDEARSVVDIMSEMLEEKEAETVLTGPNHGPSTSLNSTGYSKYVTDTSVIAEEDEDAYSDDE